MAHFRKLTFLAHSVASVLACALICVIATTALAEQTVAPESDPAAAMTEATLKLPAEQPDSFLAGPEVAGHTAWMLVSCALVLFMTAPGLVMFYGGLVRKKNVLSVAMQCIFLMGLMTVIWAVYGYSLAFGGSNPFIGNFQYLFMNGVARTWDEQLAQPMTPMHDLIPTLPRLLHMLFPRHVLHHHARFDLWCVCGEDEV